MKKLKQFLAELQPKKWLPYLLAIMTFTVLTLVYVSPVLEGKKLMQSDIIKFQGMSKEVVDFREQTGEEALWTNAMFSGMPAFQISVVYANNISHFLHRAMTLWLPRPADMIFLYFLGFFIFLLMLKVNLWIALAGAIAFAFSSYHFIILEAGHNSKAIAIAYMAPVLGAVIQTYRGRWLSGGLLFAIFMGLQLFSNHFQITYYLGITLAICLIFELIRHIKEKKLPAFIRASVVLLAGLIIAIGLNISNFWSTYTYTSETMRGGSELSIGDEQQTSGLTKEYITNWSYGIHESFSLLIPNIKGGATGMIGNNPRAMAAVTPALSTIVSRENHYWGNQPITSGPVYVGAVVLFLFLLGLFYLKGPVKWGMLIAIILSIMLSWGKNFMPLTDFFIDYFPAYNKFRAVSMTLVIAELCIPALAFLGLHKLYKEPELFSFKSSAFLIAVGLTAGISLLFYVIPGSFFSFISQTEATTFRNLSEDPMFTEQIKLFTAELEKARLVIFRADALRSMLFALAAAGLVWLYAAKKLKPAAFIIALILLIIIDMWPVNRRYLNNDDFIPRRRAEAPFPLRQADAIILEDQNPNFRVLDISENPFTSSRTSYYHHSIGGYHGAKLQRYQDLIDFHITPEIIAISRKLQAGDNPEIISDLLADQSVLNMLNTRYIIYQPDLAPLINANALGNAWFVSDYKIVPNADEEIKALHETDVTQTAVIDQRFEEHLRGRNIQRDDNASVILTHAQPNLLKYQYESQTEQLLVFSEVYYADGWNASIDGQPLDHIRVNYILRAAVVPPGTHEIEFRFEPRSYYVGEKVSLAFSVLLVLLVMAYAGTQLYKRMLTGGPSEI